MVGGGCAEWDGSGCGVREGFPMMIVRRLVLLSNVYVTMDDRNRLESSFCDHFLGSGCTKVDGVRFCDS